jgi:hypothetical protein
MSLCNVFNGLHLLTCKNRFIDNKSEFPAFANLKNRPKAETLGREEAATLEREREPELSKASVSEPLPFAIICIWRGEMLVQFCINPVAMAVSPPRPG